MTVPPQMPEMNEVFNTAVEEGSLRGALGILLLQNIGMLLGVSSLFLLAFFSDSLIQI